MENNQTYLDSIRKNVGCYRNVQDVETVVQFAQTCLNAQSAEDIFKIIEFYENTKYYLMITDIKYVFNSLIGWSLPSRESCELVVKTWKARAITDPECRIIDVGAGSGIYSFIFQELGIPKKNIVAFDLTKPTHKSYRSFFPITTDDLEVRKTDILFMAWPYYTEDEVSIWRTYLEIGGNCIIIQGEIDGCTFPSTDHYKNKQGWIVKIYDAPCAAGGCEALSINTHV